MSKPLDNCDTVWYTDCITVVLVPGGGDALITKARGVRLSDEDYAALLNIAADVPDRWRHRNQPKSRGGNLSVLLRFVARHERQFSNLVKSLARDADQGKGS